MILDRSRATLAAMVLLTALAPPRTAGALQPRTATILTMNENGTYVVVIDRDTLLAIPREMAAEDLNRQREVRLLRADIALKDSLLASYERTVESFATFGQRDAEYVSALEEQLERYRELYATARRLRDQERWVTLQGGIGATGDSRPALLAGVGIRSIRVWGFLQEHNSGGFIGLNVPVF